MRYIWVWICLGILLFSAGSALAAGSAGGQAPAGFAVGESAPVGFSVGASEHAPSLPPALVGQINDADVREWLCLETKIAGQPLIAKVAALENWLKPALEGLAGAGLSLKWEDYQLSAEDLRAQQARVCAETDGGQAIPTGAGALKEAQSFYQKIVAGRDKFQRDFARDFNTWANQLLKDSVTAREKFNSETRPKLEQLQATAQADLDTRVRADWEARRQAVMADLRTEAEAQFRDLTADDLIGVRSKALEYFKEHWAEKIQVAERDFLLGTRARTEEARKVLLKQMDELIAQDGEARKILATEQLQGVLSDLDAKLLPEIPAVNVTEVKKLAAVKKKILAQTISAELVRARQVVDERAEKLAAARKLNENILSAEMWQQKLKADEQDLMSILDNGDLNQEKNLQLQGIFEDKWNALRQQLETAEFQSARAVLVSANRTLKAQKVARDLKVLDKILRVNFQIRQDNEKRCRAQDKNFSEEVNAFQKCVICQSVVSSQEQKALEALRDLQPRLAAARQSVSAAADHIAPYRAYSNALAEEFKNQTQQVLNDFARAEQTYLNAYAEYSNNLRYLSQKCAYLEKHEN